MSSPQKYYEAWPSTPRASRAHRDGYAFRMQTPTDSVDELERNQSRLGKFRTVAIWFCKLGFIALAMAAIVTIICCIGGCTASTTPDQTTTLTIAADSLAASEVILTAADQLHLIPSSDRPAVAAAVYLAQKDLGAAEASIGQSGWASALAQLNSDLAALVSLRAKYPVPTKPATIPTTTQPTTVPTLANNCERRHAGICG
jgi:hypothetical protein